MFFKRKNIVCFIAFFAIITSFAQNRNFSFQHYGPEEGLSNTNVFAIKQSKNNLLYFATENGVYEFDGYLFSEIKPKTFIKSNDIRNLEFTKKNDLIIINRSSGVYQYNKLQNTAEKLNQLNFKNSVDELIITDTFAYSLTDQISVNTIELAPQKQFDDNIKERDNGNQAYAIYKAKNNRVYVGRTDGLYVIEKGVQTKLNLSKKISVYSITENSNNELVLGGDDAIYVCKDNQLIKTIPITLKNPSSFFNLNASARISKLITDKYNRIWFSTYPDDNLYLIENNKTYDVFELLSTEKLLINCLFKDSDDNIWLGTFNDGVYLIQNPAFQNISFNSGRKNLQVTSSQFINNQIAVGTENGLYLFDPKSYNTQTIVEPDDLFGEKIFGISVFGKQVVYTKSNSFNNTKKTVLANDAHYTFYPLISKLFYENNGHAIMADATANVYAITNYFSENPKVIDTLISFPDYRTKIFCAKQLGSNYLMGTSNGLSIYNSETKKYKNYSNSLLTYAVNDIAFYENKTYLATDNGITVLEDTSSINNVGEQKLSAIKKIKFYENKIWLATIDGLIICDTKFNPIVIFNKTNGLLSNTINDIVFNNKQCCICTNKGITLCNVDELLKQTRVSDKLFISNIEIDDSLKVSNLNSVNLLASQNDVTIYFSSPLFVKPNKQYYRYKFDDGKWSSLENTQIHLVAINGGKHRVEIICSKDGINWSDAITIDIKKEIPFTKTIWFIALIIGASLFLIIGATYLLLKRVKSKSYKKIEDERQVNLLKHQAMNSLMSPHFIFNSLTSIQNYINANDSLKASEYLAKFSRLIRMIIEKASQGEIVLHEELTRLNYYLELERERFKGKFDFKINVDENVNTLDIKIPNMIIQPYAENSIIHGILPTHKPGLLTINFKKTSEHTLQIIIDDDGIGYNKAKENVKVGHKSLGTKTIENILELNSKLTGKKQNVEIVDKSDINPNNQGTQITITINLN